MNWDNLVERTNRFSLFWDPGLIPKAAATKYQKLGGSNNINLFTWYFLYKEMHPNTSLEMSS